LGIYDKECLNLKIELEGDKMFLKKIGMMAAALAVSATGAWAATTAPNTISNVVFIVDKSGSMSGEQAFLQDVVGDLDAALGLAGVTNRSYGVVGFGRSSSVGQLGRVLGSGLTNATDAATNLGNLEISGGFEDGYSAINFALTAFNYTAGAAINFILVTDEDRDNGNNALTTASIRNSLTGSSILLNAVVNNSLRTSTNAVALGVDSNGDAYSADGSGGFTTTAGGVIGSGSGTTKTDYADLAVATGGAVWDLNQLRAGGLVAESFTQAFIDIKVQEIISQPPSGVIPLPAAGWMLLAGIGGLAAMRRRKDKAAA
jgi:hypothetical protein